MHRAGQAPCLREQLNSNVRHRNQETVLFPSRTSALRREQNSHKDGFAAFRAATRRRAQNIGPIERLHSSTGEVRCEKDTKDKGSTVPIDAARAPGGPSPWLTSDASCVKARKPERSTPSPVQATDFGLSSSIFCFHSRTDA
jgi:hypothetical protein